MTIDMQPSMAQSVGTSRSSFSSSNGIEDTPLHNSAAISNADDYDSDTSNFAPPTPTTLSMAIPDELAGAIPVLNRFQVEGFLRLMQKQIQSAGKRGFFSKKSVGPQVRERFTFEDMLCFQKGGVTVRMADVAGNVLLVTIEGDDACLVNIDDVHLLFSTFGFVQKIITFEKAGFQALVQFSDTETASSAKNARDGRRIPSYLLPDDVGPCTTRITYSAHTDLSVKFQSHQSRDYTGAHLPIAPSAIDGSGQVRLWELTPHSSDRLLL